MLFPRIAIMLAAIAAALSAFAQEQPVVLRTSTVIDGTGHVLHDPTIVVQNAKIVGIGQEAPAGARVYDLRRWTVLPGWVDTHVHITWHFNAEGRAETRGETPQQSAYAAAGNAWATLMSGFTTVQSLGAPDDKPLREATAASQLPGPRILTALRPICGEAKAQGLRSVVHAYKTAIRSAVLAGCTTIEHGTFATDDDLKLMAERGTWFDPQVRLVIQNYLDHKQNYLGIGNYTEEGFKQMQEALPLNADLFRRALKTPGLKIIFGTDAVAGAHGHNAEEFIYRVKDAGEPPMHTMTAATSLAAESLGLGDRIGRIAPGYDADIIALDGSPLDDITAVRRVVFVMKGGKVMKHEVPGR